MKHTHAQIQYMDGYKPLCRYCQVSCDRTSREYRGMSLCPNVIEMNRYLSPLKRRS